VTRCYEGENIIACFGADDDVINKLDDPNEFIVVPKNEILKKMITDGYKKAMEYKKEFISQYKEYKLKNKLS
jgi:hypothetical protein